MRQVRIDSFNFPINIEYFGKYIEQNDLKETKNDSIRQSGVNGVNIKLEYELKSGMVSS